MKPHGGNGDIEPSFLNSGNRSSLPGHFSPKEIAAGINQTEGSVGHDQVRAPGNNLLLLPKIEPRFLDLPASS